MSTQVLDEYAELLREHRPAVPRTAGEHERLVRVLESIDLSGRKPSAAEAKLAELLAAALLVYEAEKCPPLAMRPHEVLAELMANEGMTQAGLARLLGVSRTTVNHIVHGKQGISKGIAVQLAKHFLIDVGVFLGGGE